jgi:hypothetical protein
VDEAQRVLRGVNIEGEGAAQRSGSCEGQTPCLLMWVPPAPLLSGLPPRAPVEGKGPGPTLVRGGVRAIVRVPEPQVPTPVACW